MLNIADFVRLFVERFDNAKQTGNQYEILKHAINAEAKTNKDLAGIICRGGARKTAESHPRLFNEFSTYTEGVLLTLGAPANQVFGEQKLPSFDPESPIAKI